MTRLLQLLAVVVGQVVTVLLLARAARLGEASDGRAAIQLLAAVVYGIPALLTVSFSYRVLCRWRPGWRMRFVVLAPVIAGLGHIASLAALMSSDDWLISRYVRQMQARLDSEARFSGVRLLGCSRDYALFPYIPVSGRVSTANDRRALDSLFRDSRPPAFVSVSTVRVDQESTPHAQR